MVLATASSLASVTIEAKVFDYNRHDSVGQITGAHYTATYNLGFDGAVGQSFDVHGDESPPRVGSDQRERIPYGSDILGAPEPRSTLAGSVVRATRGTPTAIFTTHNADGDACCSLNQHKLAGCSLLYPPNNDLMSEKRMPRVVDFQLLSDMGRMNERVIALGRKSWLFAGSDRGGERSAAMYSLIATASLNDVDPRAWLADVLARIADHPASRLHELLPWNWSRLQTAAHAA